MGIQRIHSTNSIICTRNKNMTMGSSKKKKKKTKTMPMSMAGLVMGQGDIEGAPKVKPKWVIIGALVLVAIEVTLKFIA